jgi:hypothetical protein
MRFAFHSFLKIAGVQCAVLHVSTLTNLSVVPYIYAIVTLNKSLLRGELGDAGTHHFVILLIRYAGCGCNFCAFCFEDCGNGAPSGSDPVHQHVSKCPVAKTYNNNAQEAWLGIRRQRVIAALKDLDPKDRGRVTENLQEILKTHGMHDL